MPKTGLSSNDRIVAWDTETFLWTDDNPTPPVVCSTFACDDEEFFNDVREELPEVAARAIFRQNTMICLAPDTLAVLERIEHHGRLIVGQNIAYDWLCQNMYAAGTMDLCRRMHEDDRVRDTMVRELLMMIASDQLKFDPRQPKANPPSTSLETLSRLYLGIDLGGVKHGQDVWRLRYSELDGVPLDQWPEAALRYALDDAALTLAVFKAQNIRAQEHRLSRHLWDNNREIITDELNQVRASLVLSWVGNNGFQTDEEAVKVFKADIIGVAAKANIIARRLGIIRINRCKTCGGTGLLETKETCLSCHGLDEEERLATGLGKFRGFKPFEVTLDTKKLRALVEVAYTKQEIDPPLTDTGLVSASTESLEESGDPDLMAYADCLFAAKLLDTFIPILEKGIEYPIRPRFQLLMRSGRSSCRNPNAQNPPRLGPFRECIVPPDGYVFVSCDYSYQELCTLAQVCYWLFGHSQLGDYINEGKDPHTAFAAEHLLHISYKEAERRLKAKDPIVKAARQAAKVANFGLPGGLGVDGLIRFAKGYGVFWTKEEAKHIRDTWMAAYPEMSEYFTFIRKQLPKQSWDSSLPPEQQVKAVGVFIQLWSGRVRGGANYTGAANSLFQGLAADVSKAALWEVMVASYFGQDPDMAGVYIWNFVHDEILAAGPRETAHIWGPKVAWYMTQVINAICPDVRGSAEPALMERWLKEASPVYENGKLIPWRPKP